MKVIKITAENNGGDKETSLFEYNKDVWSEVLKTVQGYLMYWYDNDEDMEWNIEPTFENLQENKLLIFSNGGDNSIYVEPEEVRTKALFED